MTIFVDASALVAMIAVEPGFELLAERLDAHAKRITSPVACWEAVTALRRSHAYTIDGARFELDAFLLARGVRIVDIGKREGDIALDAYNRYGKGQHPARLNMGDCFAYACAKTNDARLLYKGNDFAQTDLA